MAIRVAPVSTTKRIGRPLTCASVKKWPRLSALSTTAGAVEPAPAECACPIASRACLPAMSKVAALRSTDRRVTPSEVFCPTDSVRGVPPSICTTALLGNTPTTTTWVAFAPALASRPASVNAIE